MSSKTNSTGNKKRIVNFNIPKKTTVHSTKNDTSNKSNIKYQMDGKVVKKLVETNKNTYGILINSQNRNIPIGPKLKNELKKLQDHKPNEKIEGKVQVSVRKKQKENFVMPESSTKIYGAPELHSTLRLMKNLQKVQDENPDLSLLVNKKLESPNTSGKIKKAVSCNYAIKTITNFTL